MSSFGIQNAPRFKLSNNETPPNRSLGKRVAPANIKLAGLDGIYFDNTDQKGTNVVNAKIHVGLKTAPFHNRKVNNCLIPGTIVFASRYRPNNNNYVSEEVLLPIQLINNINLEVTFLDGISKVTRLRDSLVTDYMNQSKFAVFQSGSKDAVQDYYGKFRYLGTIVSLLQEPFDSRKNTSTRDVAVSVGGHCSQNKNIFYSAVSYSSNHFSNINPADNLWIIGKNIISSRNKSVDVTSETRFSHIPNLWVFTLYGLNTNRSPVTHAFTEDIPSSYRPVWDVSRTVVDEMYKTNSESIRSNINMNHGLESGNCVKKGFKKSDRNRHFELQTLSNVSVATGGPNATELNYKYNNVCRAVVHKVGRVLFDKGASSSNIEPRLFDKPACDVSNEFELIARI